MATGVVSWSKTAASNATADSNVNFAEGQAPSSLNDSARGLMASVAKYRDDLSGALVTGGTSTAYTLASNQIFPTAISMHGHVVAFTPHATNGASPTLNVDGQGAAPLRGAPSTNLGAGVLVQGTPYAATYNNGSGEWLLHNFYGDPYGIPVGGVLPYVGSVAPNSNFALPYGQDISRTTYAALFALVGTAFGSGNGTTTFNLPDLRGRAVFGRDNMGGSSSGRISSAGSGIVGDNIGATGGAQNVAILQANLPNVNLSSASLTATTTASVTLKSYPFETDYAAGSTGGPRATDVAIASFTTTIGGSVPLGGSGTALNNMPPAIILPYILRIL